MRRDSIFLSRIGGGWHAGRICGSGWTVFVHRARGAGAGNHPLRNIRELVRDVLGELNRSLSAVAASMTDLFGQISDNCGLGKTKTRHTLEIGR